MSLSMQEKPILSEAVRVTRRAKGLTQAALASAAGCKQSAVSMFEAGRSDALSAETVTRICDVLGMECGSLAKATSAGTGATTMVLKSCPADECPSNIPYVVQGRLVFKPTMIEEGAERIGKCRYCGEPLLDRCPNEECGTRLADGSFCAACGAAYVTPSEHDRGPLESWADVQRARIKEIRELSRMERTNRGG